MTAVFVHPLLMDEQNPAVVAKCVGVGHVCVWKNGLTVRPRHQVLTLCDSVFVWQRMIRGGGAGIALH